MNKTQVTVLLLALGLGAAWLCAQEKGHPSSQSTPTQAHEFFPPPPHHGHHLPPPPPVMVVIDANHDGKFDAQEIANAAAALLKLDKNNDGELTFEELRPPFPPEFPPRDAFEDGDGPERDCPESGDAP